jgi:hypothetical protein
MFTVPVCTQQLETKGFAVVRDVLSEKQIQLLSRGSGKRPEFALVRRVYEGLPMRIVEGLAGAMVLSFARYGAPEGWHRGRTDTIESGAPLEFTPGYDVALVLESRRCSMEAITGSGRLGLTEPVPAAACVTLEFSPTDVVILDSRALRRWPVELHGRVFWFSVVRPWMTALMEFHDYLPKDTPPRARQFAGRIPARDVGEWLFTSHAKRNS